MVYWCRDCEEATDEPEFIEVDPLPFCRGYHVCPHCGSDDLTEAKECAICGEYAPADEMVRTYDENDWYFCPKCKDIWAKEFSYHLREFFNKEQPEVRALINEIYDGERF